MQLIKSDSEIKQASLVFTQAFLEYPLYTYLFPERLQREKLLPILFEISAKYLTESVYCIKDGTIMQAVLLMDSPQKKEPSFKTLITIAVKYVTKLPVRRSIKMLSIFNEIHKAQPKSSFYYIQTIAVNPDVQGAGLGKKVIDFVKKMAGNDSIYLETNSAQNVDYYKKRGFSLYQEFKCDNGKGPGTWSFIWLPA